MFNIFNYVLLCLDVYFSFFFFFIFLLFNVLFSRQQ